MGLAARRVDEPARHETRPHLSLVTHAPSTRKTPDAESRASQRARAAQARVAFWVFVCLLGVSVALGVVRVAAPRAYLWLLLGVTLYFLAVSGGAVAAARLRLPVMPIACVLAAAGVVHRRGCGSV